MTAGLVAMTFGYGLSQFYRAFLSVLAPTLETEIGASAGDLALSSGLWFLAFSLVQVPIGIAFDRFGARFVSAGALGICAATGAALFAVAQAPWHLHVAMTLIGLGCAPILMASYYLLARYWPAASFGTLAGIVLGGGSIGNIFGTAPLVFAIEAFGWRMTLAGLAVLTVLIALLILALVHERKPATPPASRGSILEILHVRPLWSILPLLCFTYSSAAAVQGVWAAPFMATIYHADSLLIGRATLAMSLAMVIGNVFVGAFVRLVGGLRRAIICITIGAMLSLALLAWRPDAGLIPAFICLAILGASAACFPLLIADAKAFLPDNLVGRGMAFLNTFTILGVGVLQFISRPVYHNAIETADSQTAISHVFLLLLIPLSLGFIPYLLAHRQADEIR